MKFGNTYSVPFPQPLLSSTRLDLPHFLSPHSCLILPHLASPRFTSSHSSPHHASRLAPPYSSLTSCSSPRLASPQTTSPHLASPYLASPHLASPGFASPHLTSSGPTSPHLTWLDVSAAIQCNSIARVNPTWAKTFRLICLVKHRPHQPA